MCGIIACSINKPCFPFINDGLESLSHRGYDSWGICLQNNNPDYFLVRKGLGIYKKNCDFNLMPQHTTGLGHVRWASTGKVSIENAHPIAGGLTINNPSVYVVHNGIIENYQVLKEWLIEEGYSFQTETDTEVIAHLLSYFSRLHGYSGMVTLENLRRVTRKVMNSLRGSYAFAAISKLYPDCVVLACHGSSLVFTTDGYAASEASALPEESRFFNSMASDDITILKNGRAWSWDYKDDYVKVQNYLIPKKNKQKEIKFAHHMRSEIEEQTKPYESFDNPSLKPVKIKLFGCGSSYHAALLGRHYLEFIAGIPCSVEYATEVGYLPLNSSDYYIGITQSGETKDTISALDKPIRQKLFPNRLVITNNENCRIVKENLAIFLNCGPEKGVAATKTFTHSCLALLNLAVNWCDHNSLCIHDSKTEFPKAIQNVINKEDDIQYLAQEIHRNNYHNILYLARGMMYPIAKEGALKMKEVAYRHAEAMHSSEIKHGAIALIDPSVLSIFLITNQDDKYVRQVLNNLEEIKARDGKVLVICDSQSYDEVEKSGADWMFVVPDINPYLQPLVVNVALQLLAYHVAILDNIDVDHPKNLSKCVTVS